MTLFYAEPIETKAFEVTSIFYKTNLLYIRTLEL